MATATLPTQEQINQIAASLAPDVVKIRIDVKRDWADDPSVVFKIVLADSVAKSERLGQVAIGIERYLQDELRLWEVGHSAYYTFRSNSEFEKMKDPAWA